MPSAYRSCFQLFCSNCSKRQMSARYTASCQMLAVYRTLSNLGRSHASFRQMMRANRSTLDMLGSYRFTA
ncbi:hypothetical protein D3C81_2234750 [compost metagenome]